MIRALLVVPALLAAALAGCAAKSPTCDDGRDPLTISAQRDPARARVMVVETVLTNCTGETLEVSDPCGLTTGLVPALDDAGETFYLQNATTIETTAVPNTHLLCDFGGTRTDEVPPGAVLTRRSQWDGAVLTPSGTARPLTGAIEIYAQAGPLREAITIQVPWS